MIGQLTGFSYNRDKTQNITVTVSEDFSAEFDELKNGEVSVEIKKYFKRRSLDANAYCWTIIDKIAEKTGEKKSDIYRHAIKDIGGVSMIAVVENEAVNFLCKSWEGRGTGWMTEVTQNKKYKNCSNVTLWFGSSVYDTRQMSALIDSVIQEAENLGIPTITDKEREKLLGKWTVKTEKGKTNDIR